MSADVVPVPHEHLREQFERHLRGWTSSSERVLAGDLPDQLGMVAADVLLGVPEELFVGLVVVDEVAILVVP